MRNVCWARRWDSRFRCVGDREEQLSIAVSKSEMRSAGEVGMWRESQRAQIIFEMWMGCASGCDCSCWACRSARLLQAPEDCSLSSLSLCGLAPAEPARANCPNLRKRIKRQVAETGSERWRIAFAVFGVSRNGRCFFSRWALPGQGDFLVLSLSLSIGESGPSGLLASS